MWASAWRASFGSAIGSARHRGSTGRARPRRCRARADARDGVVHPKANPVSEEPRAEPAQVRSLGRVERVGAVEGAEVGVDPRALNERGLPAPLVRGGAEALRSGPVTEELVALVREARAEPLEIGRVEDDASSASPRTAPRARSPLSVGTPDIRTLRGSRPRRQPRLGADSSRTRQRHADRRATRPA